MNALYLSFAAQACLILTVCAGAGEAHGTEIGLYDQARNASVEILVNRRLSGSGMIVDERGTVLTAAHVVANSKSPIEVRLPRGGRVTAELVAVDPGHDIALLQLPENEKGYACLKLADKTPDAGKTAYLFGAPLFRHGVLVRGSVARNDTTFEFVDGRYVEVVHVCAPAAKGLSGGPWFNDDAKVFGVQSSLMSLGNAQQGISFVAPLKAIRQLIKTRKSKPASSMGAAVEEIWEQQPKFLQNLSVNVKGVVVRAVKKDGPAAANGIENGVIISAVEGKPVELRDDFIRIMRGHKPGEVMKLTIIEPDGKRQRSVDVRLTGLSSKTQQANPPSGNTQ